MKKIILFSICILGVNSYSQIYIKTGGATQVLATSPNTLTNVGVGVNTPKSKLDVEGNVSIGVNYSGSIAAPVNGAIIEGKVGVGNSSPTANLDVSGGLPNGTVFSSFDDKIDRSIVFNAGSLVTGSSKYRNFRFFDFPQSNYDAKPNIFFGIEDRNDFGRYRLVAETGGTTQMIVLDKTQTEVFKVYDDGNNNSILTLPKSNSYLCIGTTSTTDGTDTYKLSVNGAIRASRVRVYTTWADYVFEKNYNLSTIEEVEKHIMENGHLKDIPSAKEVEEKGIDLGDMNKRLLQKVEELTLYIIELNKKVKVIKEQLKN